MVSIDMVGVGVTLPGAVDTATLLATKSAMNTHTHTTHPQPSHISRTYTPGYLLILYIHHASSGLKLNSDKKYGAHVTLDVCVTLSHAAVCNTRNTLRPPALCICNTLRPPVASQVTERVFVQYDPVANRSYSS